MGLSSALIGLLPTFATLGVLAQILLVSLRIIQGFALGGESTGAQLMAIEFAGRHNRGKYSGLLGVCSPLSQILANGVLFVLAATMSDDAFQSYGWRIPFLLSFLLVIVGLYIRLRVEETPAFAAMKGARQARNKSPLADTVRLHWQPVLRWMLFFCGPAAIFYLITVFSLGYITNQLSFSKQTGFAILMAANVCAIVGAMAGGILSDKIGRKPALAVGSVGTLLMLAVYFPMLNTHSLPIIVIAAGLFLGLTQFQSGIQPVAFAEAFPTNVRYTGSSLAYSGANLISGGPMPVLAVWLLNLFDGSPIGIIVLCGFWNILSLIMILTARETLGSDLNYEDPSVPFSERLVEATSPRPTR
jgi:MFS family permease